MLRLQGKQCVNGLFQLGQGLSRQGIHQIYAEIVKTCLPCTEKGILCLMEGMNPSDFL